MLHTSCREEIVARELQVVLRAFHITEERVVRQPAKNRVSPAFVISPRALLKRRPINDHPPTITGTGGLRAINAADNRGLCAVLES